MNHNNSPEKKLEKSDVALREEATVAFWKEKKLFEKSLAKSAPKGDCIFYDGPPFATGLPHYGHILGGTGKDAIARYKTMQGFRVPRKWGWDTHGLPIETIVEKSLGITSKKQIEEMGLDVFAREARSKVLGFVSDWKKTVDRTGRWVDFDGSYKTMDTSYIESVWWALGELHKKGLIYEADRILPYCPRCQTPLANAEIAMDNSYKDITDISAYVKIPLKDHKDTFFIAWTTTPWTLPGNTALAVNPELEYVKVAYEGGFYFVGKDRFEAVFKDKDVQIVDEFKGNELVGMSYLPPFDYFTHTDVAKNQNIWKVYPGDFVTAGTGTGVVHIAPSFGEDDANLAKKYSIPTIKHVLPDGTFAPEVTHFAGVHVKPKDDHQAGDVEIIKYLAHNHLLFAKEKIIHSYPHCYRCETPLLYYGLPSWFINVQKFKPRILELNQTLTWIPDHLKDGRFTHILENAPDWNFSRNRFWASPLPIWKSSNGKMMVVNSVDDLKKNTKKSGNKYFVMRHGKSEGNECQILANLPQSKYDLLCAEGKENTRKNAEFLKDKKIDLIISSDFTRTQETAAIVADVLGIPKERILPPDARIREIKTGIFEEGPYDKYHAGLAQYTEGNWFEGSVPGGESLLDVQKRVGEFMYELDREHTGKNILIVTHSTPAWMFFRVAGLTTEDMDISYWFRTIHEDPFVGTFKKFSNAEIRALNFVPLPHDEKYSFDLHRPYIDAITLVDEVGNEYQRIPEVIDCWFESGSMPFAQDHYPFERPDWQNENFPADFVVEYIAQTRTWFYYTLLVSTILFDRAPFKNIVTTGNLNGTDGQKMSKSKGNYPDPWILMNKYGADALRIYLMSSVLMKGEDSNFVEKTVDDIYKKIILKLGNCLSFVDMYHVAKDVWQENEEPKNVLDQWILARLSQVIEETTKGFESYNLVEATKGFVQFVDDLSAWYLRRSRDRFKSDDEGDLVSAGKTLVTVLKEFSKVLAPIAPFIAEDVYQKLRVERDLESVHLEDWPKSPALSSASSLISDMEYVRGIVSMGLEARSHANIKVRQPLQKLSVPVNNLKNEYLEIIQDELNVKEVVADEAVAEGSVVLDTEITDALRAEGNAREFMRAVQDLRKTTGLNPHDVIILHVATDTAGKDLIQKFTKEISKTVGAKDVVFVLENKGFEVSVEGLRFTIELEKLSVI